MFNVRGQAALEFLTTFGGAVFMLAVVTASLSNFGVFSPEGFLPERCSASTGFGCGEFAVFDNGSLDMVLSNEVGGQINFVGLRSLTIGSDVFGPEDVSCLFFDMKGASLNEDGPGRVGAGESFVVNCNGIPSGVLGGSGGKQGVAFDLAYRRVGERLSGSLALDVYADVREGEAVDSDDGSGDGSEADSGDDDGSGGTPPPSEFSSCEIDGVTVDHGDSQTFYVTDSVAFSNSFCDSQERTCNDGALSGDSSYSYSSCTPTTPSPYDCYDANNVGEVGLGGSCEDMLIVNNSMLRSVSSSNFRNGGNETYMLKGPDDNEYTFDDSNYNVFTGQVNDMSYLFRDTAFNQDIGYWDVSNVVEMEVMFDGASSFNQDIGSWNVSQVESMVGMFQSATSFNQNINSWQTSSVTDMRHLFDNAAAFNQPLNNWDTSNVLTTRLMFRNASNFNQPLNSWSVSNVNDISHMFRNAINFNQPLNAWDVSNVENMNSLFFNANNFNQNIDSWQTSSLKNMTYAFGLTSSFNQPLNSWDVSKVQNFEGVFRGSSSFDQSLNNWDLSNATSMSFTFTNADNFNSSIDNWDVSNVVNMNYMFYRALNFDQPLGSWNVSSANNMDALFSGATNFNQDIASWNTSSAQSMESMFMDALIFNQDISTWCVEQIASQPDFFDTGAGFAGQTTLQPDWGVACS